MKGRKKSENISILREMRAKSMSFVLPLKNSGKFFLAEKRKKRNVMWKCVHWAHRYTHWTDTNLLFVSIFFYVSKAVLLYRDQTSSAISAGALVPLAPMVLSSISLASTGKFWIISVPLTKPGDIVKHLMFLGSISAAKTSVNLDSAALEAE